MRHLFTAFLLASAFAIPAAAHANPIDDFVLTGNGHTYTFSLPATGPISGKPGQLGVASGTNFTQGTTSATVDGVGGYGAGATFLYYANVGTLHFSISPLGTNGEFFDRTLFGRTLIDYTTQLNVENPTAPYEQYTAFHLYGTFDLGTITNPGQPGVYAYTPYTLTITPEASTAVTPEPATLTLLATGSLGLLTALRRRLT